jgi:uncharacterized protein
MPTTSPADPAVDRTVDRARDHLHDFLQALHRAMREAGLGVPTPKQVDFLAGIEALAPSTTGQLYWIGVTTLVTSESGRPVYDEVFRRFFGDPEDGVLVLTDAAEDADGPEDQDDEEPEEPEEQGRGPGESQADDVVLPDPSGRGLRAGASSPEHRWRFGRTSPAARALMDEIAAELPRAVPRQRSRRHRPGRRHHRVDLRAVYLESRRTHGEIVRLRWRHRPTHPRRVLVLVDVSGSMKQHSPEHLRFAHAVVASCPGAEVLTFGTRLTRVTAALHRRDVDDALDALAPLVLDADGGTSIGESLEELLADPHLVTAARGALVLVLSDGLERGDCAAMVRSVGRLSRLAHRLVWWSPLACDPAYRPLTKGMAAVLGDLDALAGVRDLETALTHLRSSRRNVG